MCASTSQLVRPREHTEGGIEGEWVSRMLMALLRGLSYGVVRAASSTLEALPKAKLRTFRERLSQALQQQTVPTM